METQDLNLIVALSDYVLFKIELSDGDVNTSISKSELVSFGIQELKHHYDEAGDDYYETDRYWVEDQVDKFARNAAKNYEEADGSYIFSLHLLPKI